MATTTLPRPVRKPVIAANWKLHKGPSATRAFFEAFGDRYRPHEDRTVLFFPPAVSLPAAAQVLRDRPDLGLGAQDIYWEAEGAFTGEISAPMARDAGAVLALVGHSERRHVFGETDEDVRRKLAAAIAGGLTPVLCVGETLEQRRAGRVEEVIVEQLRAPLEDVGPERIAGVVVAYEPVWAIGTGETASPADAAAAHGTLRSELRDLLGGDTAREIPILYGGSVKPHNAAELLAADDVDGALVGGASLDPDSFAEIASV